MLYKLIASLVDCQQGTCVRLYQTIRSYKKTADTDSQAGKKRGRQKIQISTNTGAYSQINDLPVISSDLTVFFPTL